MKFLTQQEEYKLLHEINSSEVTYPKDKSIVELFEQQVELTPDSTALVFGDEALSYKELNQRANQLANYLQAKGVTTQTLVPLYTERGEDMIIGMLGILKAGGVYVPIDSESPQARINFVLEDTKAKVVVSQSGLKQKIKQSEVIDLDTDKETISKLPTTNPINKTQSNELAYIIYTSGSTGQPKGVMIEHRSLVDYVYGLKQRTELEECKSFALVSTIATDLGNTVIYGSLLTGGALHVFSKETVSNIEEIHRYFKTRKIDCLKIVPSHWKALRMDDTLLLPQKLLIFGGEALQSEILDNIREANAECTVVNHYGPTETTIGKLLHVTEIQRKYGRTIPIGKPFGNTKVYILSPGKDLRPMGIPGELYIGGDGLARGYLNNDALSKEKFIQNPFSNEPNDLIYATGDSVKYLPDGNIEYLGRIDEQLKIRGYRIEPGEIESSLEQIKTIERAVVVAKEDKQGNKRLVAYIVPNAGFEKEEIISQLKESLPDYMIPAQWIEIESVPLMASGKTDRKALPDADLSENLSGIYVAPTDETEQRLATIWEDILEVEKVGINDDFFELGGHSLLAIRLISAIRKAFEVEMPIGDIFDYPTIALLKTRLETSTETVLPPIQKAEPRPERIPLSFSQERLWFIDRLEGSLQYHIPTVLQLKGNLNKEALEKSIRKIIERHEVLRTVIKDSDGEAYQQINNSEDWKLDQTNGSEGNLEETIKQRINTPFDLSKDYMLRCTLIEQSQEEHTLVAVLHHIASDGWSNSITVSELVELYKANLENREAQLPEQSVQYADFAIWQRNYLQGEVLETKLEYWKEKLLDLEPFEIQTDYSRPPVQSIHGAITHYKIQHDVAVKLNELSQEQGTTMFMTLLTAFNILLHRYTDRKDICVGTPISGRLQKEVENLIGFFLNTLALRNQVNSHHSFKDLLQQVKSSTLEAFSHQEVPFEKVVEAVVKERDLSRSPLFQILFLFHNNPDIPELKLGEVNLSKKSTERKTTKFDLTFSLFEGNNGLNLTIEYCTDLYSEETINHLAAHYLEILGTVASSPQTIIKDIPMLRASDTIELVNEFNNTSVEFPGEQSIINLFENQVKKTPQNIALVFGNKEYSYESLNLSVNRLANYLLKHYQLKRDDRVGVLLNRSDWSAIAMLAINKAGACYLPIDQNLPKSRISYIIKDAEPKVIITNSEFSESFSELSDRFLNLESISLDASGDVNPGVNFSPEDLSFVIYTSGSTGAPKGVPQTYLTLQNLIQWDNKFSGLESGLNLLQYSSFAFDSSLHDIFFSLSNGGCAFIVSDELRLDFLNLAKFINQKKIEILSMPFAALNSFIDSIDLDWLKDNKIRHIISTGEQLQISSKFESFLKRSNELTLHNFYGPSETHVVTSYSIKGIEKLPQRIPIGKPIANCTVYLLNKDAKLLPKGALGEIYLGGSQLSRGYLNNDTLTDEKFVQDPFSQEANSRLYKTGDIGRWLPDGNLEYLGRIDDQIKIRGYRVELGEIENILLQNLQIKQAIVIAKESLDGYKRLIVYLVAGENYNKEIVIAGLKEKLPEYMIPQIWVELEKLPLNQNGKIDKKALPEPDIDGHLGEHYVAPRNPFEETIVNIWQDLIGLQKVGITDNFFEIGGHSLLAMRVISAIRKQMNLELPIKALFQNPTIEALANYLESESDKTSIPEITQIIPRPEYIPLSFSQERLWFIDKLEGSLSYHLPTVLRLRGNLDISSLEQAIRMLISRHEILRTVIKDNDGKAYQQINSADNWKLERIENDDNRTNNEEFIRKIIYMPFDLSKDYMLRCTLLKISEAENILVATFHHIASDGWSTSILVSEVVELYASLTKKRVAILPELNVQYADYAIWQRNYLQGELLLNKINYWKQKLEGLTILDLPADFTRPPIQSNKGASVYITIDKQLRDELKTLSQQHEGTLFMILLSAFKVLLSRYTGQTDICIGTPIAGRQHQEIENLIGFFINTLVLRTTFDSEITFTELLSVVKKTTLEAFQHQEVPFEKIVDAMAIQRDPSRSPLFQVLFRLHNQPEIPRLKLGDVELSGEGFVNNTTQLDLIFNLLEHENGLNLTIKYCTDLFREDTILRMQKHFLELLKSIVKKPTLKINDLQMITPSEESQLIKDFNDSKLDYANNKTIIDLFEDKVKEAPEAVALIFDKTEITYRELNEKSNQLANYLKGKNVKAETLVPICIERSVNMIVGILGILKAGGAYIPIDPEYPVSRINYMIEDVGAGFVLSSKEGKAVLKALKVDIVEIDAEWDIIKKQADTNLTEIINPSQLAYIIYTSGSTGLPKGVMIEHGGLANLAQSQGSFLGLTSQSRTLLFGSLSFDASVFEIFTTLSSGAALVITQKETLLNTVSFNSIVNDYKIDIVTLPPSFLELVKDNLGCLQTIVSAGEALSPELARSVISTGIRLINAYGPTETTVCAMETDQPLTVNNKITIGKPLSNKKIYILNESLGLCPIGIPGEIHIGGEGIARAYLNKDELTSEKFINDPFKDDSKARLYKTGDLGKWLPDGNLEYLGRVDDQVKIRGYRVELGEIENALQQSGLVTLCVVKAKSNQTGNSRLVAYYIPVGYFNKEKAIQFLEEKLPHYMIPQFWIELSEMPVLPNGKIDKNSLPDPDSQNLNDKYVAPGDDTEEKLAEIFKELLELDQVGVNDDFFDLGGHSILAIRLASSIRNVFKVELAIGDIFDYPTIGLLKAHLLNQIAEVEQSVIQRSIIRSDYLPLSFSQERLWFIHQLDGSIPYHIPTVLRLEGNLNKKALNDSLKLIIQRHEVLRSVINIHNGKPYQHILDPEGWNLKVIDGESIGENLQHFLQQQIIKPFNLSLDFMMRAHLIELSENENILLVTIHHIASDGWSKSILVKELTECYNAFSKGREPLLTKLTVQYSDFAIWQNNYLKGNVLEQKLEFWKQTLEGVSPLELPTDYQRPANQRTVGKTKYFKLDNTLKEALNLFSRKQGTTLFMTLLASFKVLMHRYSGQNDICVGTPVAGRQQKEIENLIGFFINTIALRSHLNSEESFINLLQNVKSNTIEAFNHQEAPFEKVVELIVKERDLSRRPLFQVMFVFQNTPDVPELNLGNLKLVREANEQNASLFDLTFRMSETPTGLSLAIEYCTDLFKEETIIRLQNHFSILLNSIVSNPSEKIENLQILSSDEELQLKETFNNTKTAWPEDKTVVELFEEQVTNTPDSVALVFENQQLTYHELNQRANQLAHYLRSKGVQRETLVPICIERSMDMMIAILGVLKSGGAYVPIDPEYPTGRIAFMLEDTNAKLVLSHSSVQPKLSSEHCEVIALDSEHEAIAKQASNNPELINSASDLAYIIYTSGSTGQPKGVMVEQGNIVSLVKGIDYVTLDQKDVLLSTGSPSFDATTIEYWGMLLNGGKLVICRENTLLSSELLKQEIIRSGVTKMWFTSSWFNQLVESDIAIFKTLKTIIAGGEKLSEFHIEKVRQTYPELEIINGYGPTENTTFSLTYNIRETEIKRALPIGRPLNNRTAYILDKNRSLLPVGVNGEIYLGGAGLSRGYLNNALLTEEKFIQNPFSKDPNSRLYKTGDIGRWLPEGIIEYTGRKDDQVKIRGYRIELGEIENAIQKITTISHSVVLTKEDLKGYKRLIAYYVPKSDFSKEVAIAELSEKLPDYMVPQIWVELQNIPLTANGKIDKRALPDPDIAEQLKGQYVAPGNETETKLAEIWKELLDLERIGIHDNFFEVGGHSLLAIRMISEIRKAFEFEMPIGDIFEFPTISSLTQCLENQNKTALLPPIEKVVPRPEIIPLSFSQERLWFIHQLEGSVHYHVPTILKLKGELNKEALIHSLKSIIERHEVLRTVIKDHVGKAFQQINSSDNWQLEVIDGNLLNVNQDSFIQSLILAPFDLSNDYMLRGNLLEFSEKEYILVITIHHIATDGWSASNLVKEVVSLYNAYSTNKEVNLPLLPIQYADFAIWQRKYLVGTVLTNKIDYWKQKLDGVSPLDLPTDFLRPAFQSRKGANSGLLIEKSIADGLSKLSQDQGTTLFMTLLAAFKVLLYRYSNQEDICVGTPIVGRQQKEIENLIGNFINTLALRSHLNWQTDFITLLKEVKSTTLEAFQHQEAPFEKVVEAVIKQRDLSRSPIFQVLFSYHNTPEVPEMKFGEMELSNFRAEPNTAQFELICNISESRRGLHVAITYCTDLYTEQTINRLLQHFQNLLESILNNPNQKLGKLNILSLSEENMLTETFNLTQADYPKSKTVIDLFEEQVKKTPNAIALVYENQEMTFEKLNKKADQLAEYLINKGVKAEAMIPVCVNLSIEMIVAILGILKAGAAYVPIDSEFPEHRIRFILDDIKADFVITNSSLSANLSFSHLSLIELDRQLQAFEGSHSDKLSSRTVPSHLAYVIYTSGSTGLPKGVMVEHHNLLAYLLNAKTRYIDQNSNQNGTFIHLSYTFDASLTGIFMPLIFGKPVIIGSKKSLDMFDDVNLIKYAPYDFIKITPSHLEFLQPKFDLFKNGTLASRLVIGGESLYESQFSYLKDHGYDVDIINEYGPTETTVGCCTYTLNTSQTYDLPLGIPIGKPIDNVKIRVLNEGHILAPIGVYGEIYIGGNQVTRGYLNNTALTATQFLQDPLDVKAKQPFYKSGDIGRWLPDGNLQFKGRKDEQVKIKGYRIELGEIENVLEDIVGISRCAVLVKEDKTGNKRLTAYIVPRDEYRKEDVLAAMKLKLPEYMIPQIWVELKSLPMTVNGKIDRKALPDPESKQDEKMEYMAARNDTEAMLIDIWQELLGLDRVGVTDNFFDIGGDSLMAVRIIATIRRKLNNNIELMDLVNYPTIEELVLRIGDEKKDNGS